MPFAIDQEALESPNMKVLDINKPPTKNIPHQAFPKAVYLHPKDKTQAHRAKVVESQIELEDAQKQGWRTNPHIPVAAPDAELANFEYEAPEEKRGPGRPKVA
jgi:hypothetical protein